MPLYRTLETVFGPSPQVCAEINGRVARTALLAAMKVYAESRYALGTANRRPVDWQGGKAGCRRYHQAEAMRTLNARRAIIRVAERRLVAAEAAITALTLADAFAIPYLAQLVGVQAVRVAA